MSKLEKRMYVGSNGTASNAFGLSDSQIRADQYVHNGGWYNRLGQKLGWGDLTLADLERIAWEIDAGELFIVLSESASFRDFKDGKVPGMSLRDEYEPGVPYVAKKCLLVVSSELIRVVEKRSSWYAAQMNEDPLYALVSAIDIERLIITHPEPAPIYH